MAAAPLFTTAVESFMAARPELEPVFPIHWEELALFKDKMPLDPCWESFAAYESTGKLLFVTLRERGRLAGYFVGIVAPALHYHGTLTAKMDLLYVVPEHRGNDGGNILLDAVMAELKRRGVQLVWMGSKNHKPIEGLFESRGFTHEESYFAKWIGE